jgi:hypothetical protein
MRRRVYENRSSFEAARKLREKFVDRPMTRVSEVSWTWPKEMREVGTCESVMYTSDKWRSLGDYIDYKHISEAPQRLLVKPGFIVDYKSGKPLRLASEKRPLDYPMPDAFAELARILALQVRFLDEDGDPGEYHQVNIARATLGAARHPTTGETFLIVYTPSTLCAIIVGDQLDVEKDGIVG